MSYRTAVKTDHTAGQPRAALAQGSIARYTAMVEQLSAGYVRPLLQRLAREQRGP
jgi:hypothetical protein